jgi:hypothetical protein
VISWIKHNSISFNPYNADGTDFLRTPKGDHDSFRLRGLDSIYFTRLQLRFYKLFIVRRPETNVSSAHKQPPSTTLVFNIAKRMPAGLTGKMAGRNRLGKWRMRCPFLWRDENQQLASQETVQRMYAEVVADLEGEEVFWLVFRIRRKPKNNQ